MVTLHLYDTASRRLHEFQPLRPGQASLYLCGATVQGEPHIGHMRSAVVFDILRRWLTHLGFDVTLVRNVTDIDDKILQKSKAAGAPWFAWAYAHEQQFTAAYRSLGVLDPTYEPRATGHVPEMITLMQRLIAAGHAYATDAGDVYFAVATWDAYGELSHQRPDEMRGSEDAGGPERGKRDPRDFALWKAAKPGEPSWPTPWGDGRPGWHLECSAMATKYCGAAFDIHGGGLDLIFPHHENELAQSRAAGDDFAHYWMHNAWVTTSGEKMSKSLGNTLLVHELTQRVRPIELRYYIAAAHYRSMLEFSPEALDEAAAGFRRIESFVRRASERHPDLDVGSVQLPAAFVEAMNDDLGVPAALAEIHGTVTRGNEALQSGAEVQLLLAQVRAMTAVLGVDPLDEQWATSDSDGTAAALDKLVSQLLQQRAAARQSRDFAAADAVRDTLLDSGVTVSDGPDGSTWSLSPPAGGGDDPANGRL